METCFKLHGFPYWHPKGETTPNTKVEATPKSHSSTAARFVAKSGISNSALNLSIVTRGSDWIINSGVTDHMTCDPHKFTNFPLIVLKVLLLMPMGSNLLLKVYVLYPFHPPYQFLMFYLFLH